MTKYALANMSAWVRKSKARQEAVAKTSVQRVGQQSNLPRAKGGRMPVVTSTLRGSMVSALNGQFVGVGEESAIILATTGMKIGDKIQFGWGVVYARRVNSGFVGEDKLGRKFNQTGAHFIEYGTDQWKAIVAAACKEAEARLK